MVKSVHFPCTRVTFWKVRGMKFWVANTTTLFIYAVIVNATHIVVT
jgi:hypothetical protein